MHGITHSKYGDIVMVKANPVNNTNLRGYVSYSPDEEYDTKTFLIPEKLATGWIINIAKNQEIWEPNMLNYTQEEIFDGEREIYISVYVENSMRKPPVKMVFPINSYSFPNEDSNISLKEEWVFESFSVNTPHGKLDLSSVKFINDSEHIGIQFNANGIIRLNEIDSSMHSTHIAALGIIKRRYNAWVWIQLVDKYDCHIISFCGGDLTFGEYVFNFYKNFNS